MNTSPLPVTEMKLRQCMLKFFMGQGKSMLEGLRIILIDYLDRRAEYAYRRDRDSKHET